MLDIDLFRTDKGGDPNIVRESEKRRFAKDQTLVDTVLEKDAVWRKKTNEVNLLRRRGNEIQSIIKKRTIEAKKTKSKEPFGDTTKKTIPEEVFQKLESFFGDLKIDDPKHPLLEFSVPQLGDLRKRILKELIPGIEEELNKVATERSNALKKIGNIVSEKCVVSKDEDNNGIVRVWGEELKKEAKYGHRDLLLMCGGIDTEMGSKVAGNRGYFMMGDIVRLNYALINYGLDFLDKKGYKPVVPPFFMKQEVMSKVAQLEQFDEELYKVTGDVKVNEKGETIGEKKPKYLIATSEQPICGYHLDKWIGEKELPQLYCGMSTNFRKEVGSHGKDTLGIFRVHQFDKIEQFAVTSPKESWEMFDKMIGAAEGFWKSLKIPFRVVNIVSGKLNNAAAMKYDLEGWFPNSGTYRELVSCSNCTDYQSRRLETRYGKTKKGNTKEYVHMLNSTLCATTRAICAIAENYQTEEGIVVPEVLRNYMGGKELIKFIMAEPPKEKVKNKKDGKKKKN